MNTNETHAEDERHNVMCSDTYVGKHRASTEQPVIIRDARSGDVTRIAGDVFK